MKLILASLAIVATMGLTFASENCSSSGCSSKKAAAPVCKCCDKCTAKADCKCGCDKCKCAK